MISTISCEKEYLAFGSKGKTVFHSNTLSTAAKVAIIDLHGIQET